MGEVTFVKGEMTGGEMTIGRNDRIPEEVFRVALQMIFSVNILVHGFSRKNVRLSIHNIESDLGRGVTIRKQYYVLSADSE